MQKKKKKKKNKTQIPLLWEFMKVSALLDNLVAEDGYKGSWEIVENVRKMVKSPGKESKF